MDQEPGLSTTRVPGWSALPVRRCLRVRLSGSAVLFGVGCGLGLARGGFVSGIGLVGRGRCLVRGTVTGAVVVTGVVLVTATCGRGVAGV